MLQSTVRSREKKRLIEYRRGQVKESPLEAEARMFGRTICTVYCQPAVLKWHFYIFREYWWIIHQLQQLRAQLLSLLSRKQCPQLKTKKDWHNFSWNSDHLPYRADTVFFCYIVDLQCFHAPITTSYYGVPGTKIRKC